MKSDMRQVKEDNDSLFLIKFLNSLGLNQRRLSLLLDCSNVVNHWIMGYRRIPSSFKRFMLVIKFIHELGLLPQLLEYIKYHERKGWGTSSTQATDWLNFSGVDINKPKKKGSKNDR